MNPLQISPLQASTRRITTVTRKVPVVPPAPVFAIPSTTNRKYVESTTTNVADTVLKIAKEASEAFKNVPYNKALAGIIIQIISIREEIQTEKERSQELIDKILRRSKVILDGLLQVASSPNRDQLKAIEGKLKDYDDLLSKTLAVLKTHTSKHAVDRIVNRKSRLGNVEKYDRLIDDFNTDFVTYLYIQSHLTNMSQPASLPSASNIVYYKPVLPPPSELMISRREKTRTTVVEKGGKNRLSNLGTSIHLSAYGPQMQAVPNTICTLAMLSVQPDGLPWSEPTINELQRYLHHSILNGDGHGSFAPSFHTYNNFEYDDRWQVNKHVRLITDTTGARRGDLVGFGESGVWISINNGDGTFQPGSLAIRDFAYLQGWRIDQHPRFMADITGDGRADIVGFGNAGVLISQNQGDGTFASQSLALADFGYDDNAGGWRVDKHLRFLADSNGDGLLDIYGFGHVHVFVSVNNILVDGTFKPPVPVIDDFAYSQGWRIDMHPRFVADLTGNGKGDIIGFGYAGVYVALNDGQGRFGAAEKVLTRFGYDSDAGDWRVDKHPRVIADVTGDGTGDIVGFGNNGVWLSTNNGDGTFRPPQLVLSSFGYNHDAGAWRVGRHPRFLADLTGNGHADIIGFGDDGVYISINNGDGTFGCVRKVDEDFAFLGSSRTRRRRLSMIS